MCLSGDPPVSLDFWSLSKSPRIDKEKFRRVKSTLIVYATACGRCRFCSLKQRVESAIKKRREEKSIIFLDDLNFTLKEEARKAFIRTEHIRLEFYPRKERTEGIVRSVKQLSEAFEKSFKKFMRYIRSIEILRRVANSDRTVLARNYASLHFIYEILRRSKNFVPLLEFDLGSGFHHMGLITNSGENPLLTEFFRSMLPLLNRVKQLNVTAKEFAYLRAFSFFNPRVKGLKNKQLIKTLWTFFWNQLEILKIDPVDLRRDRFSGLMTLPSEVRVVAERLLCLIRESNFIKSPLLEELLSQDG
ncbi:uncharacterized protein LOC108864326 [Galendromus occidentalis]|uniref:Uncharacterized protein LOC108864326 n=1 Tax=Galendromus occidentalis TaxID=34638 RepID=A0AAJ7L560_9ACAR|nr:uncharacterized protein LOC108864326 [Galendromus occidentalis]